MLLLALLKERARGDNLFYFTQRPNCYRFKLLSTLPSAFTTQFSTLFLSHFIASCSVCCVPAWMLLSSSPSDYRTWNESSRYGSGFIKIIRKDNAGRASNHRGPDYLLTFLRIRIVQLKSECARWDTEAGDKEWRSRHGEFLQQIPQL